MNKVRYRGQVVTRKHIYKKVDFFGCDAIVRLEKKFIGTPEVFSQFHIVKIFGDSLTTT